MERRSFITGAAALPVLAGAGQAQDATTLPDLMEEVMRCVVPVSGCSFVSVPTKALRELCEAHGVVWTDAYWLRRGMV